MNENNDPLLNQNPGCFSRIFNFLWIILLFLDPLFQKFGRTLFYIFVIAVAIAILYGVPGGAGLLPRFYPLEYTLQPTHSFPVTSTPILESPEVSAAKINIIGTITASLIGLIGAGIAAYAAMRSAQLKAKADDD